jgi:hypothetical protein
MGRAEDLFSRIEREGIAFIDSLIADRATEELFLEFKRSSDSGQGNRLHEHDRANLRKAISGFANSEGGVVVWGIDCSKDNKIGDVAQAKVPITNARRYVSWIEGAVSGCSVPPVTGIRSVAIEIDATTGVVATLIPKSPHAPHQVAGEGKYMIRAGSDFVPAPHGVVAGLFGHAPHPVVYPNFTINPAKLLSDGKVLASAGIMLVNNGQVVAEDLFVSMLFPRVPGGGETLMMERKIDWPVTSGVGVDCSIISPREVRLAPGGFVTVMSVHLRIDSTIDSDYRCKLTAGCRGSIPYSEDILVTRAELLELASDAKAGKGDMHEIACKMLGLTINRA